MSREIRIPNKPENLTKAYNLARATNDMQIEVKITYDWIIIKQITSEKLESVEEKSYR